MVQNRKDLGLLRDALAATQAQLRFIRLDLQGLHEVHARDVAWMHEQDANASLAGLSFVERRDVTTLNAGRGDGDGPCASFTSVTLGNAASLDESCAELDIMLAHVSTALETERTVEGDLKVLSKLFEQKDRTCSGVLSSLHASKDAGEAGWSVHTYKHLTATTPTRSEARECDMSVKKHQEVIQELDSLLLAALCSSRKLKRKDVTVSDSLYTPSPSSQNGVDAQASSTNATGSVVKNGDMCVPAKQLHEKAEADSDHAYIAPSYKHAPSAPHESATEESGLGRLEVACGDGGGYRTARDESVIKPSYCPALELLEKESIRDITPASAPTVSQRSNFFFGPAAKMTTISHRGLPSYKSSSSSCSESELFSNVQGGEGGGEREVGGGDGQTGSRGRRLAFADSPDTLHDLDSATRHFQYA